MNLDVLNNKIVIIDDRLKNSLLKLISDRLINTKIITLSELKRNYYFDYDNETIYYVCNKNNVISDIAKIYINNLYYISNIDDDKIRFLKELKSDLEDNNLLYKNDLFNSFLKGKEVLLIDSKYIDKFYINILNDLKCKIKYIDLYNHNSVKTIYECTDMEEEISLVCSKISELLKNEIDINNIKLSNVNSDYYFVIKKYFKMFNIPINLDNNSSINGTHIVKIFKNNYKSNIKETLEIVYESINSSKDMEIYKKLINIVNSYSFIDDYNKVKDLILNDISNTKMNSVIYDNAVNVIDFMHEIVRDDDYVFLINYNEGVIPISHKDEDYLSDKIKSKLNISTSFELNDMEVSNIREKISSIKNMIITYSTHNLEGELYISSSYDEDILKKEKVDIEFNNSNSFNKYNLVLYKDLYNKYGTVSEEFKLLNNKYKDMKYLDYDNKFKGIELNNNSLMLSYSNIEKYNECAFKYYLDKVLVINKFEDSYSATIGNITHKVLSLCFNDDFDFEKEFNEAINNSNYEFKDSELYFLKKIKATLQKSIEVIKKQLNYTQLKNIMYEKELIIEINKELNIRLKGYIDKIMCENVNGFNIIAIIDYKTGLHDEASIKNIGYGINMQLPIYMYLIKKSNIISNVKIGGMYLQKIYSNKNDDDLESSLKLQGYTNSDVSIMNVVDNTYDNSKLIKNLKTNQDGSFNHYANILTDDELNKINDIVESKIKECSNNIINNRFDINPKVIGSTNYGCRYCKYKDICFVKEEDKVNLPPLSDSLGGEV